MVATARPKNVTVDPDVVAAAIEKVLRRRIHSSVVRADIKRRINDELKQYTGHQTPLLSTGGAKGAVERSNEWVLGWKPSRPRLMHDVLSQMRAACCLAGSSSVISDGDGTHVGRLRLVLKFAISETLRLHGDALVACGELEDASSAKSRTTLHAFGTAVLPYLVSHVRMLATLRKTPVYIATTNANTRPVGDDARGAAIVFDEDARMLLDEAISTGMTACDLAVCAKASG